MRYARNFSFIFFIFLIFFVSGCIGGLNFGGGSGNDFEEEFMFVGGDEALTVDFIGNNPPDRIFQGREFDIALIVQNVGEYEVPIDGVQFKLNGAKQLGVDCMPDESGCIIKQKNTEKLMPIIRAGEGYIPGGIDYINYEGLKYVGRNVLTEESPLALSIEACYPYKTVAVSDLCVTTSTESSVCDFFEPKTVFNSGSPLEISSIEQEGNFMEDGVLMAQVRISINHDGDSELYSIDSECNSLASKDFSRVTIESISLGNEVWTIGHTDTSCRINPDFTGTINESINCANVPKRDCTAVEQCRLISSRSSNEIEEFCGQDNIRLNDGEGFIVCFLPVGDGVSDYEERLVTTVSYVTTQIITKDISVMPSKWSN